MVLLLYHRKIRIISNEKVRCLKKVNAWGWIMGSVGFKTGQEIWGIFGRWVTARILLGSYWFYG